MDTDTEYGKALTVAEGRRSPRPWALSSPCGQLRIALNNGVTTQEVVEVLIQPAAYAGVARAFEGYGVATQVFGESRGG